MSLTPFSSRLSAPYPDAHTALRSPLAQHRPGGGYLSPSSRRDHHQPEPVPSSCKPHNPGTRPEQLPLLPPAPPHGSGQHRPAATAAPRPLRDRAPVPCRPAAATQPPFKPAAAPPPVGAPRLPALRVGRFGSVQTLQEEAGRGGAAGNGRGEARQSELSVSSRNSWFEKVSKNRKYPSSAPVING